jgi:hypothetical protein
VPVGVRRLRRQISLLPGWPRNLAGLACIAVRHLRRDHTTALIDEPSAIAEANDAQRILDRLARRAEISDLQHARPD